MKIVAVSMFKDEADVCEPVIEHLLSQGVDHIIVADNASRDGTRWRLDLAHAERPELVTVLDDFDVAYYQALKMTGLARIAGDMGADWVLPFDADELWFGCDGTIREALDACPGDVVRASGYDYLPRRDDAVSEPNPFRRLTYRRRDVQVLPKVAFRWDPAAVLAMGNHDVEHPGLRVNGTLTYAHFQYRSLEQMTRKLRNGKAAYDATNLPETYGAHWRQGGALDDEQIAAKWDALLAEPNLVHDPAWP